MVGALRFERKHSELELECQYYLISLLDTLYLRCESPSLAASGSGTIYSLTDGLIDCGS